MSIKDGGPAFPWAVGDVDNHDIAPGMTLRDWFAGRAIVGILTSREFPAGETRQDGSYRSGRSMLAEDAYLIADAMIAARDGAA